MSWIRLCSSAMQSCWMGRWPMNLPALGRPCIYRKPGCSPVSSTNMYRNYLWQRWPLLYLLVALGKSLRFLYNIYVTDKPGKYIWSWVQRAVAYGMTVMLITIISTLFCRERKQRIVPFPTNLEIFPSGFFPLLCDSKASNLEFEFPRNKANRQFRKLLEILTSADQNAKKYISSRKQMQLSGLGTVWDVGPLLQCS